MRCAIGAGPRNLPLGPESRFAMKLGVGGAKRAWEVRVRMTSVPRMRCRLPVDRSLGGGASGSLGLADLGRSVLTRLGGEEV